MASITLHLAISFFVLVDSLRVNPGPVSLMQKNKLTYQNYAGTYYSKVENQYSTHDIDSMHTVFGSQCFGKYFDWMAVAMYESFRKVRMPGKITRLLACDAEELKNYKGLHLGPTFHHPDFKQYRGAPESPTFNKPGSLHSFVNSPHFKEEYLLSLDSDMIFFSAMNPREMGAKPGTVVSEEAPYLVGTKNGLADRFIAAQHIPWAEQVGFFFIFHRDDLVKTPLTQRWLDIMHKMRTEPDLYWKIGWEGKDVPTGQEDLKRGEAPWIAEMYGYSFAAAEMHLLHRITRGAVPQTDMNGPDWKGWNNTNLKLVHYGHPIELGPHFTFDKHYVNFDIISSCAKPRFLPQPPLSKESMKNLNQEREYGLGSFVIHSLNEGWCNFYQAHCGGHPAVQTGQDGVRLCASEVPSPSFQAHDTCIDKYEDCWYGAVFSDECDDSRRAAECQRSCRKCHA